MTVCYTWIQTAWFSHSSQVSGNQSWAIFLANGPTKWQPVKKFIDFTTCGPKNYGYVTKNARGMLKTSKKVKGLHLTDLVEPLVTVGEMNAQVDRFTKRKAKPLVGGPAKQACLVKQQKKATRHYNKALSGTFVESGVATCLTLKQDVIAHGSCNCMVCANKTSVTVP